MLFHVTCVQLYELGDYFDIALLRGFAFETLRTHLHAKAIEIQHAYAACGGRRAEPEFQYLPEAFLEALFRGIAAAFKEGAACKAVQDEYVFFVRHTRYWLLADAQTLKHLGRAPWFAVALLCEVLDTQMWAEVGALPARCSRCDRAPLDDGDDGGHWGFHYVDPEQGVVGDCNNCALECRSPCCRCGETGSAQQPSEEVVAESTETKA
jgi:hypothetical protein